MPPPRRKHRGHCLGPGAGQEKGWGTTFYQLKFLWKNTNLLWKKAKKADEF